LLLPLYKINKMNIMDKYVIDVGDIYYYQDLTSVWE
jgi:hypothetical protein